MTEVRQYGFDWFTPSGEWSGWSLGPVPEDVAARGWYSVERGTARSDAGHADA